MIPHGQGQRNCSKMVGTEAAVSRYPTSKGKEKPQQDGRRGEFAFKIKLHSHKRRSESSNKPYVHSTQGTHRD